MKRVDGGGNFEAQVSEELSSMEMEESGKQKATMEGNSGFRRT